MSNFAEELVKNLGKKKKKIRRKTVSERGIPLETLKSFNTSKIIKLTKKMKGGRK